MKIKLDQIKGALRDRVELAISQLESEKCRVIAFFLFKDTDHDYSWRSKGKYIAIRYQAPFHDWSQYEDKKIYLKKP